MGDARRVPAGRRPAGLRAGRRARVAARPDVDHDDDRGPDARARLRGSARRACARPARPPPRCRRARRWPRSRPAGGCSSAWTPPRCACRASTRRPACSRGSTWTSPARWRPPCSATPIASPSSASPAATGSRPWSTGASTWSRTCSPPRAAAARTSTSRRTTTTRSSWCWCATTTRRGRSRTSPGTRICGSAGSTTLARVAELPDVEPVPAAERADCLVKLQEGEVDGMSTNDTILVGFRAQDPNLRFLDGLAQRRAHRHRPAARPARVGALRQRRARPGADLGAVGRAVRRLAGRPARRAGPGEGPPAPVYVD